MKPEKKRAKSIKGKVEKLLAKILQISKGSTADVLDLISVLKYAHSTMATFFDMGRKTRPQLSDHAASIERKYVELEEYILGVIKMNKFGNIFGSWQLRMKVDALLVSFFLDIKSLHVEISKREFPNKNSQKNMNPSDWIQDGEARTLWEKHFADAPMAAFPELVQVLSQHCPAYNDTEDRLNLRYTLDAPNSGYVGVHKFADFVEGFGPLKTCVDSLSSLVNLDFFHGFVTTQEAEKLLHRSLPGTFLLRFSYGKTSALVVSYVETKILHTLIHVTPSGFTLDDTHQKPFAKLGDLFTNYSNLFKVPFSSSFTRQSWYFGDITSQEAEELLTTKGSFLFRLSSKPELLSVSYNDQGTIKHSTLEITEAGFRYDKIQYKTLQEVVRDLKSVLTVPVSRVCMPVPSVSIRNSQYGAMPSKYAMPALVLEQIQSSPSKSPQTIKTPPQFDGYSAIQTPI